MSGYKPTRDRVTEAISVVVIVIFLLGLLGSWFDLI